MTGMRRGEVLGLTWFALDLAGVRLTVDRQLVVARGGSSFGPPKSERSRRTIALDSETVNALRGHRDGQLLERTLAGEAYDDADLVFATPLGLPLKPRWMTGAFAAHRRAAGLPAATLHTLRHTHATLGLSNGVPIHVVAARLGDRPETVLRVYAHLLPQSDVLAAEQVAALLSPVSTALANGPQDRMATRSAVKDTVRGFRTSTRPVRG